MKKKLTIIISFLLLTNLYSITLPVKQIKITSSFGESRKDHFHNGMDFGGGEQEVYAIQNGNIIFYYDKSEFPFDNYPGSGNFIILDHGPTRSYYMHLKDKSINKTNFKLKEGSVIGITSDTGHSYGIHLHFNIEKKHPFEILNPLLLYRDDKELINDKIPPRIENFLIKVNESNPVSVLYNLKVKPGSLITILARAIDLMPNSSNKINPYKITCFVNGLKYREYVFDKLKVENNSCFSPPNFTFNNIYYDESTFNMGEFQAQESQYIIKIVVEDFSGNSARIERSLIVKQ